MKEKNNGRPKDQGLIAVFGDPLSERILDVIEDSPKNHRREARQPLAEEAARYVFEHGNTQEALAVAFEALLVAMDERIRDKHEKAMNRASMPPLRLARF